MKHQITESWINEYWREGRYAEKYNSSPDLSEEINAMRQDLGEKVFNTAVWASGATTEESPSSMSLFDKAFTDKVKAKGKLRSHTATTMVVQRLMQYMRDIHTNRLRRVAEEYKRRRITPHPSWDRTDSLENRTHQYALKNVRNTLRHTTLSGMDSLDRFEFHRVDDACDAKLEVDSYMNYGHRKVTAVAHIPVHHKSRVRDLGIATLGGSLVLDAEKVRDLDDGYTLYKGAWAQQGRGYKVTNKTGHFVAPSGTWNPVTPHSFAKSGHGAVRAVSTNANALLSEQNQSRYEYLTTMLGRKIHYSEFKGYSEAMSDANEFVWIAYVASQLENPPEIDLSELDEAA